MHVLLITSEPYPTPSSPLSGIFQQHQARGLRRYGVRVGVLSPELRSLRALKQDPRVVWPRVVWEEDRGVPVLRYQSLYWIPFSERGHLQAWTRAGLSAFHRYVRRLGRPDLVHAHNTWPAGILAHAITRRHGLPFVITEHSSAFARHAVPRPVLGAVNAALGAASVRAAVSTGLARLLEGLFGEKPGGYRVIPNTIGDDFERHTPLVHSAGQPHGWRFVNIGSLLPIKGQDVLLEAFASGFSDQPSVMLRIIGDGPLLEALKARARDLGIAAQVVFTGQLAQSAVRQELETCDAYVHASRYETFGVAIIEALCCGRPVVATRCGGPEDLVTDQNGRLVPPDDPGALAAAMVEIRASSRSFDAEAIRRDCLDRYGEAAVVRTLVDLYGRSIGPSSPLTRRSDQWL